MDFNALEDGGKKIVISRTETKDFEICSCGEGYLYLAADKTHLKVFRHTPNLARISINLFAKLNWSITSHK